MLQGFRDWFRDPLHGTDGETSAVEIFALVGLVIVCAVAWRIILSHLVAD